MATGGSVEELPWIVEEDAFGLRHPKREWEGRALLMFLPKSHRTPCPPVSS